MRRRESPARRACAAAALGTALLGGCALAPPEAVEVHREALVELPRDVPRARPSGASLQVLPVQSAPGYEGTGIAYSVRPYEIAYFGVHEWAAPPARMFEPLLVRTLESTGRFAAVVAAPAGGHPRYALRTEQLLLLQDFSAGRPTLELSLRVQLIAAGDGRVVAAREIAVREPMREREPHAGVVAANEAAAKALREVAGFVVEQAR
ncbi:MAG: ABC-type transport auxiliary lipoprotein family protein [Betaproteobacteria bacterium]